MIVHCLQGQIAHSHILRPFFVKEQDERIANILWNYFDAVRRRWPESWNYTGTGRILNRTNGFNALMRLLRPAYRHFTTSEQDVSSDQFLELFTRVKLPDGEFNSERYKPGTSGETRLFKDLLEETGLDDE